MNLDCFDGDRLEEQDVGYDEHLEKEGEDELEGRVKRRGEERKGVRATAISLASMRSVQMLH